MSPRAARGCAALGLLLLSACSGGIALPVPAPPSSPSPSLPSGEAESGLEREIHERINRHRTARGLPVLAYDPRIAEIARRHSEAMAAGTRDFGHAGFDERFDAIARLLPLRSMSENVAYDSRTGPRLAEQVVSGWIGSPEHRKNLEGGFQATGVGVARGPDGVRYFTQIFAAQHR